MCTKVISLNTYIVSGFILIHIGNNFYDIKHVDVLLRISNTYIHLTIDSTHITELGNTLLYYVVKSLPILVMVYHFVTIIIPVAGSVPCKPQYYIIGC